MDGEEFIAGCDFEPAPDATDRLAFEEGQVIVIIKKPNDNWWLGRLGDKEGWVPASFMDPVDEYDGETNDYDDSDVVAQAMAAVENANVTLQRLDSRAQDLA